ncbi:SAVED domain-containing protein [Fictibacillus enclensis]|uniref:SAVED domain-containing protein n=1 Tax=Fictibacillus enclensis TaxID=1017270 RepID=UPI0025A08879|nr:SAVED domain-containing protein [Fictibacillus enclensis]MDM5196527.1 SAVED domain-containing protein [Fictibacillus enclensis]
MARRRLKPVENARLWVESGGICSYENCNRELIVTTDGSLTIDGIIAHIIGHAETSPRHEYMEQYNLTQDQLEDLDNLMLMCHAHSKLIDDSHTKHMYPPDRLFKMKKDHQERISKLLGNRDKNSVALIHKRLGGPMYDTELEGGPPYIILDVVEDQSEFVDFTKEGWEKGAAENKELVERFKQTVKAMDAKVGEIFPLSPIPLLVHLGSLLTDTVPYTIYQFNRETGVWVADHPNSSPELTLTSTKDITGKSELAVLISISGKVKHEYVDEVLKKSYDSLCFEIKDPGVTRVVYRDDVKKIQSKVKKEVEQLLQEHDYDKIHLFYAGPAGLAIEIGRGINPNMWPEVYVYDHKKREIPRYQYALSI